MLETTEWIKITKQCYTLVNDDNRVIAAVFTVQDKADGDTNCVWQTEIMDEEFGCYVSLYLAQLAVQNTFVQMEEDQIRKEKARKKRAKAKKKMVALEKR